MHYHLITIIIIISPKLNKPFHPLGVLAANFCLSPQKNLSLVLCFQQVFKTAYTMTATNHDHDGHSNENMKN